MVSSPAHAAPVRPSQLESVVRLTREGTRSVRLHELARSMGRARNHLARELGVVPEHDLGRMLASPRTLLVEGTTDQAVLAQVLRRSGDRLSLVQPAGSKTRLAVLHHLHLALRIPHHVLFDGDGGPVSGSSTARHRILRRRREATEALVAALTSSSAAASIISRRRDTSSSAYWSSTSSFFLRFLGRFARLPPLTISSICMSSARRCPRVVSQHERL